MLCTVGKEQRKEEKIMKYRDPQTGEFKDITIKVADTLPVGTIVEYDGTTIPNGWELVDGSGTYKKIKKTETITATNGNIVDSLNGNSTTDAPSVNAVNNKFNEISTYSTEEKVVGKWIDGKPLYRKTIEGIVSKNNENVIIGTIPNIETVAKKYGQGLAGGLYWTDLDLKYSDTVSSIIQISKTDGQMIAVFSQSFLGWPFHLTIEYTKTTD